MNGDSTVVGERYPKSGGRQQLLQLRAKSPPIDIVLGGLSFTTPVSRTEPRSPHGCPWGNAAL